MKFTNLTRQAEIGANCYALEIEDKRLVLDCGMHPKHEGAESLPALELLKHGSVDAILLSHAHQDHVGSLPVLMRQQPNAPVFATEPTRQIADVMLHNSVNVMLKLREEKGVEGYPFFGHKELDNLGPRWRSIPLEQRFSIDGERMKRSETEGVSFEFFDAGHILGSVGTLIRGEGKTIFYTGDVNFDDQTISRAASFPEEPLDVVIIETTRGDTPDDPSFTRRGEEERIGQAIADAFETGGTLLIPVFALGKTQELLAIFHSLQKRGILPRAFPIYVGGLSTKLTEIYDKNASSWPRHLPKLKLLKALAPFTVTGKDINDLPLKGGRVHALTSGMMTENTLSNIYGARVMSQPDGHLFFVGYADPDSAGGKIRAAAKGDLVEVDHRKPPVPLKADVQVFNLSAHASRESIRQWVGKVKPKKILLVHGDPAAMEWFQANLSADLPESEIIIPQPGVPIEL